MEIRLDPEIGDRLGSISDLTERECIRAALEIHLRAGANAEALIRARLRGRCFNHLDAAHRIHVALLAMQRHAQAGNVEELSALWRSLLATVAAETRWTAHGLFAALGAEQS